MLLPPLLCFHWILLKRKQFWKYVIILSSSFYCICVHFFCTWVYSIILNAVFSLTIILCRWTSRDAFQNWNLVSVARILYNTEINLPLDLKCSITYHQKHWWIVTWSSHSLSLPAVTQHNDTKLYQIIWMLENNVMNMIQTVQSTFHATLTIKYTQYNTNPNVQQWLTIQYQFFSDIMPLWGCKFLFK